MTDKEKQGRANRGKGARWELTFVKFMGEAWEKISAMYKVGADATNGVYSAECKDTTGGAGLAERYLVESEGKAEGGLIPIAVMKKRNQPASEAVVAMRLKHFKQITQGGGGNISAGVMALACGDGILLVNDITNVYGTIVIEHTSQGFLARQKGEEK